MSRREPRRKATPPKPRDTPRLAPEGVRVVVGGGFGGSCGGTRHGVPFRVAIGSGGFPGHDRGVKSEREVRIMVLGAGFGGLTFCQAFRHPSARVTLVDRTNHHLFQPLLYQVATAGLSAPEIAAPVRSIFSGRPDVTVLMDEVESVDLERREVRPDRHGPVRRWRGRVDRRDRKL